MTYEMELLSIPKEQQTITTLNKTDERLTNGITTVLTAKDLICKYANDPTFPDGIDKVPTHDVPDLLVLGIVGRKGPKMSPKIFGSASDYSMRKARCSSLIIKTNINIAIPTQNATRTKKGTSFIESNSVHSK